MQSTPESGSRAGYDGAKRRKGSKVHLAVDTLGHLLALRVTAASEQDRAQVGDLCEAVQEVTGEKVGMAFVDQGYTGQQAAEDAATRHPAGGGQASRSEERIRAAAQTLGSRTELCLGSQIPPPGARL
jgi:transposase